MNRRKIAAIMAAEHLKWPHALAPMPREEWPAPKPGVPYPVEVYRSRRFLVQIFKEPSGHRMSVNRTELAGWIGDHPLWRDGITWEELQRLKAEAGYELCWAVECYPPDDAVVNVANMRHLWILDEAPPFGWTRAAKEHEASVAIMNPAQRRGTP